MQRNYLAQLQQWKEAKKRKPLLLNGARQVGKTWLLKWFGQTAYQNCAYINFETVNALPQVLEGGYNIESILTAIQIETGIQVLPKNTLIIFDEIQLCSKAITALKYFYENAPEYHVVGAGTLLGVSLANSSAFPVGKITFLDVYPMSFLEFLLALKETELHQLLLSQNWKLIQAFSETLTSLLRQYYFVGGMPEAVADYVENRSFKQVRTIQQNILRTYELDFAKHAPPAIVPRIRMMWNGVTAQLAKENKKFIYSAIQTGARAKDYELALHWLIEAGLVHKVCNISQATMPLKAYEDFNHFKLYLLDVGLLCAMANIDEQIILQHNLQLTHFKGAITEQFVLQQLIQNNKMYYWSASNGQAEIDFVLEKNGHVIPIEVKAETNLQAKSMKVYQQKFAPTLAIKTSMVPFSVNNDLHNIPLFAINVFVDGL
jgi:uncharacterized protein